MPAKSKAQQRLMQAAEHGATFPKAAQLRASMTHQQLHNFSIGSLQGKPEHVTRTLHPALAKRAQAVQAAHKHLSAHVPGFTKQPPHEQFKQHQAHLKKTGY